MKRVSLSTLSVTPQVRRELQNGRKTGAITGALVTRSGACFVFGPGCNFLDEKLALQEAGIEKSSLLEIWNSQDDAGQQNRTALAIAMLDAKTASSPAQAARLANISPSAIYRELKRRETRGVCTCCGQLLPAPRQ